MSESKAKGESRGDERQSDRCLAGGGHAPMASEVADDVEVLATPGNDTGTSRYGSSQGPTMTSVFARSSPHSSASM